MGPLWTRGRYLHQMKGAQLQEHAAKALPCLSPALQIEVPHLISSHLSSAHLSSAQHPLWWSRHTASSPSQADVPPLRDYRGRSGDRGMKETTAAASVASKTKATAPVVRLLLECHRASEYYHAAAGSSNTSTAREKLVTVADRGSGTRRSSGAPQNHRRAAWDSYSRSPGRPNIAAVIPSSSRSTSSRLMILSLIHI